MEQKENRNTAGFSGTRMGRRRGAGKRVPQDVAGKYRYFSWDKTERSQKGHRRRESGGSSYPEIYKWRRKIIKQRKNQLRARNTKGTYFGRVPRLKKRKPSPVEGKGEK